MNFHIVFLSTKITIIKLSVSETSGYKNELSFFIKITTLSPSWFIGRWRFSTNLGYCFTGEHDTSGGREISWRWISERICWLKIKKKERKDINKKLLKVLEKTCSPIMLAEAIEENIKYN